VELHHHPTPIIKTLLLKGTIRCGTCGCRLVYSRNKGNGGTYEYFLCPRNQRGECPQGYQPVDLVEAAVEDHYATVPFSDVEREEIREVIATDLGERVTTAKQEIDRCQGVLKEVTAQERKLLHMTTQTASAAISLTTSKPACGCNAKTPKRSSTA
jgi:site-specific DNA recombinase